MQWNWFAAREIGGTVVIVAAIVLVVLGALVLIDAGDWGTLAVFGGGLLGAAGWRLATYDPTNGD